MSFLFDNGSGSDEDSDGDNDGDNDVSLLTPEANRQPEVITVSSDSDESMSDNGSDDINDSYDTDHSGDSGDILIGSSSSRDAEAENNNEAPYTLHTQQELDKLRIDKPSVYGYIEEIERNNKYMQGRVNEMEQRLRDAEAKNNNEADNNGDEDNQTEEDVDKYGMFGGKTPQFHNLVRSRLWPLYKKLKDDYEIFLTDTDAESIAKIAKKDEEYAKLSEAHDELRYDYEVLKNAKETVISEFNAMIQEKDTLIDTMKKKHDDYVNEIANKISKLEDMISDLTSENKAVKAHNEKLKKENDEHVMEFRNSPLLKTALQEATKAFLQGMMKQVHKQNAFLQEQVHEQNLGGGGAADTSELRRSKRRR